MVFTKKEQLENEIEKLRQLRESHVLESEELSEARAKAEEDLKKATIFTKKKRQQELERLESAWKAKQWSVSELSSRIRDLEEKLHVTETDAAVDEPAEETLKSREPAKEAPTGIQGFLQRILGMKYGKAYLGGAAALIVLLCLAAFGGKGDDSQQNRYAAGVYLSNTSSETTQETSREQGESTSGEQTSQTEPEKSVLTVRFIDVGQGDAALLQCDGHSMLIDGGGKDQSSKIYTILKEEKIEKLDYLVSTHPHKDHAGGLAAALEAADAGEILTPVLMYDGEEFHDLLKYAQAKHIAVRAPGAGETFALGGATVTVLGPLSEHEDLNDMSIVLRVDHGENTFLFTGDAGAAEEEELLAQPELLDVKVLKAGHHGSSVSTTDSFLKAVSPEYTVLSCGAYNEYGHPSDEILARLKGVGCDVCRTDMQGDVTFTSDGTKLEVAVEKNAEADVFQTYHDLYVKEETQVTIPETEGVETTTEISRERTTEETTEETTKKETTTEETTTEETTTEEEEFKMTYILNTSRSKRKFHYPDCRAVRQMNDKNKLEFYGTREEVIDMGYTPCGICNP